MAVIKKQYTKFVFPFKYTKGNLDPRQVKCRGSNGERSVFKEFSVSGNNLRSGLDKLLSVDGASAKIAESYYLDTNSRAYFNLPNRQNDYLDLHFRQADTDEKLRVAITDVCIYLFESGVGVFEFECQYASDSIEDYNKLNYFIAEPKSSKNYFVSKRKVGFDKETKQEKFEESTFTIKEFVNNIINSMRVSEAEDQNVEFFDIKPVIFSYILLDERPDDFEVFLKYSAKNFKDSYRLSEESYPVNIFSPFDNSHWAVTMKGVVNASYITNRDDTDHFFNDDFVELTKGIYHTLFLHVIHQKYSTMLMLSNMGELDRLGMNYEVMKRELIQAQKCRSEAYNLMFRAFFQVPSEQEHINKFYEYLYRNFRVNDLLNNFKNDIANLENLCDTYVKRIKARKDKMKEKRNAFTEIFVAIFGTLVAEITLLDSSWDIIEKLSGRSVQFGSFGVIALIAAMILPIVTIAVDVVKRIKDIRKINKDLQEEVNNGLLEDGFDEKFLKKSKKDDD